MSPSRNRNPLFPDDSFRFPDNRSRFPDDRNPVRPPNHRFNWPAPHESSRPTTLPRQPRSLLAATGALFARGPSELLSFLGPHNPLRTLADSRDCVWLLDALACPARAVTADAAAPHAALRYTAHVQLAVIERTPKPQGNDVAAAVALMLSMAESVDEAQRVLERARPFLSDVRGGRVVHVALDGNVAGGRRRCVGPTGFSGVATTALDLGELNGARHRLEGYVLKGVEGMLAADVYVADGEGWLVVSDIEDTIKFSSSGNPKAILHDTLMSAGTPVPGMPALFAHMRARLPPSSAWCYLSPSPHLLYPSLRAFCQASFPPGPLFLRTFNWRSVTGLMVTMAGASRTWKAGRLRAMNGWLPRARAILVGDSAGSDPEAYADVAREQPGWVAAVLIRRVGAAEDERNSEVRFEAAFKGVAREKWVVFDEPEQAREFFDEMVQVVHD